MAQPGEVPNFKGDESPEEADKWLEAFIRSTGSFSDAGIFRLLGRRFPSGTPARDWFGSLDGSAKASWEAFEQAFHSRWIETAERIQKQRAWNAFAHHTLSDDAIFSGKEFIYEDSSSVLHQWVEEHLRLGQATDLDEGILVETTRRILPSFIQAYHHAYLQGRHFASINELCSEVTSLPSQILLLEHTRRQLAPMEKILSMEKQMDIMAEKVNKIMHIVNKIGLSAGGASHSNNDPSGHLDRSDDPTISSNESIDWEQSSPLTSVVSINDPVSTTLSNISTPIAPALQLSNPNDGDRSQLSATDETNDSVVEVEHPITVTRDIPSEWRKPVQTKSRKELIQIARQAIGFAEPPGNTSTVYSEEFSIFASAVAIFDGITGSQLRVNGQFWNTSGSYSASYSLLHAISEIHSYYNFKWYDQISKAISLWSDVVEQSNSIGTFLKLDQASIRLNGYSSNVINEFLQSSEFSRGTYGDGISWHLVLDSIQTILLMTLSSYLAECTADSSYLDVALLAANCVKTWMIDPETSLIKQSLLYLSNAKDVVGAVLSCHLTGLAIEGFTVLSSITGHSEWNTLAIDISRAAMHYKGWHSPDGILTIDTEGKASKYTAEKAMKGLLVRGLMIAYQRNRSDKLFCTIVRSYINVQFNALYDLSRSTRWNGYGVDWRGPYVGPYTHAQIAALDTIVAAIAVNDGV
ncbi:hypothetical protein FRC02_001988 [Tulasnella sp. 418]|nr:hypothetical protein FRC02_001988 [Tulasnella sp. 418]